ncbi:ABC transporter permease subunit, partial [Acinetobacter baumannii]
MEGFFPRLLDMAQHLILPSISLIIISYAGYHMMQRTLLLDNLNADYVRTARAKGLTRSQAIRK